MVDLYFLWETFFLRDYVEKEILAGNEICFALDLKDSPWQSNDDKQKDENLILLTWMDAQTRFTEKKNAFKNQKLT